MKIKNSSKYVSHFSSAAIDVNKKRSRFSRPSKHSTTFTTGKIIPIYVDEVLPGSSRKLTVSSVLRGATPLVPVMDNAYLDIVSFFVPYRLVMDNFQEFMGENNQDAWTQEREYFMPMITINNVSPNVLSNKSYLDYLGCIGQICGVNEDGTINPNAPIMNRRFNALYVRGICKCWNDWYRNQNCEDPVHIYTDDTDRIVDGLTEEQQADIVQSAEFGTTLLPVNKFKDYFTSGLPAPQKHDPITIPIGNYAPVVNNEDNDIDNTEDNLARFVVYKRDGGSTSTSLLSTGADGRVMVGSKRIYGTAPTVKFNNGTFVDRIDFSYPNSSGIITSHVQTNTSDAQAYLGLSADLSKATAVSVNQLRMAFQVQKFYETQARGGSRYTEILLSMFGTYSSDARLQRAEYLGGKRVSINQYQVAQTSSTDNGLGDTGAFSLTNDSSLLVNKGFVEHGILYIFAYVRTDQTYCQGQERMFARRDMMDFYFPVFAHIGEQPILRKELFYTGDDEKDSEAFAYQEAWAEYRYKPNRVSGYMRPHVNGSLAQWNYANNFANAPTLTPDFLFENDKNIARSMAVTDDIQWIADFYFEEVKDEVMPVYSVPGLIDHF